MKFATPPIEDDDRESFDHPRIWREWQSDEWRTNYPPPPGFTGYERDDWESDTYQRALSDEELAALVAAGIADPEDDPTPISIEEDEAERDAFFTGLRAEVQSSEA